MLLALAPCALRAQVHQGRSVSPELVYPGATWAASTPEAQGIDGPALAAALAALPAPANRGPIMVVANGYVVHVVGDVTAPVPLFSCSKAMAGLVIARALHDGVIPSLDVLVPNTVPGAWSAYPGDATIRDFLTMTSDYGLPTPRQVGRRFAYNNHAIDFLGRWFAVTHLGLSAGAMDAAVRLALFDDIGRESALTFRGQWSGYGDGLHVACRDLARVGVLLARGGRWLDRQLLDPGYVDALFRCQIPSSAVAYQSGNPNQNSNWNNQPVTDRLGGNWGFGTWRVGDLRVGGSFPALAFDGYQGKRLIVCPRGSLPDPTLEVIVVALPQLPDEGPPTSAYFDAVAGAVTAPTNHPNHDPRQLFAGFDDGTFGHLRRRFGAVSTANGAMRLSSDAQLDLPSARLRDQVAILDLLPGLPINGSIGFVLRAATDSAPAFDPNGTQVWVGIQLRADGLLRARAAVATPTGVVWHAGPTLQRASTVVPLTLRAELRGDSLRFLVGDEDGFPGGLGGIQVPPDGGCFAVRSISHTAPIDIDNVLLRPLDGPATQAATDARGEHFLVFVADTDLASLDLRTFTVRHDDLTFPVSTLPYVVPWVWPHLVTASSGHLVLGSVGAAVPLQAGRDLVVSLGGVLEGEVLR